MTSVTSLFDSHLFTAKLGSHTINYRVLKLQDSSLFIYIGNSDNETFDDLGIGLLNQLNHRTKESTSSLILASNVESQDLARKLSLRLKKPVFVSYNTNIDHTNRPQIEELLIHEIDERPENF